MPGLDPGAGATSGGPDAPETLRCPRGRRRGRICDLAVPTGAVGRRRDALYPASYARRSSGLPGYWTNATFTPLERPAELAGKEFMTEAEAAAYEKQRQIQEESQAKNDIHYDNVIWQQESYRKVVAVQDVDRRRSAGRQVAAADAARRSSAPPRAPKRRAAAPSDSASRAASASAAFPGATKARRCSARPTRPTCRFMQTTNAFVIRHEIMNGVRIVPVDGTPHLPYRSAMLHGDSRGRWEGNTLVVDTTNFTDATPFRGPPATRAAGHFREPRPARRSNASRATDADSILLQVHRRGSRRRGRGRGRAR